MLAQSYCIVQIPIFFWIAMQLPDIRDFIVGIVIGCSN